MEKWFVATKKADFEFWGKECNISPIVARVIRNRNITELGDVKNFLYGNLDDCHSPWLLHGMHEAVELILKIMKEEQKIRIIGDYDVDGICSSYILKKGLKTLKAIVDIAIPHRMKDGYGLSDGLIEDAKKDGIKLIITCDNGIAAKDQVALAKSYGIDIIITDHHEVPYEEINGERIEKLPLGNVIIDPKQKACNYPFPNICGGVVALKLIEALFETCKINEVEVWEELVTFAALATVCDVMELKEENRIYVKAGLEFIKKRHNIGLEALIEVNSLDDIEAYHFGFVIGPCLNATGRLDTAIRAIELLDITQKEEAVILAQELKELNESRKNLTLLGVEEASEQIISNKLYKKDVIVVYLPQLHESLAGIIAGRIREKYHHPVFVITKGEEGLKGSGRSIEGFHMYEALARSSQYLTKFGGHKLAAGFSLQEEHLQEFTEKINENTLLEEDDFIPKIQIDVPMPLAYGSIELVNQLKCLEPFGVGNSKPLFAQKDVVICGIKEIGVKKNYLKLIALLEERKEEVMYFGNSEMFWEYFTQKFGEDSKEKILNSKESYHLSITYQLSKNTYRGRESLQYIMQNYM